VVANSLHEISGLRVTAALPDGADFAANGNVDAGNLNYDASSRTVAWTLNRLPTSVKSVSADFTVSVTPTAEEAGKNVPLLGETGFTATDQDTGASLSSSAQAIGTDDAEDAVQP
jgi:hypothetical protein